MASDINPQSCVSGAAQRRRTWRRLLALALSVNLVVLAATACTMTISRDPGGSAPTHGLATLAGGATGVSFVTVTPADSIEPTRATLPAVATEAPISVVTVTGASGAVIYSITATSLPGEVLATLPADEAVLATAAALAGSEATVTVVTPTVAASTPAATRAAAWPTATATATAEATPTETATPQPTPEPQQPTSPPAQPPTTQPPPPR